MSLVGLGSMRWTSLGKKRSDLKQSFASNPIGKEAVVSDPHEAFG
jgi:hypothetical protein